MKSVFAFILTLAAFAASAHADSFGSSCNDGMLCGTENLPDIGDAINGVATHKELEKPQNYPAYLYKDPRSSDIKVGRYFIDGKYPTGPIKCEHVELHEGQSDQVLTWEAHNTAASNVYYWVHRAIDYYNWLSQQVGEPIYKETKPIVIRVDMDVAWAKWIKFSKIPSYNVSQTFPDTDPDKWGTADEQREIWFNIPKRAYLPKYVPTRWIPGIKNTILGTAGFPLDSARVPSIVAHEWTHLMTRPYLGIEDDDPVNEGYSDYFGSVIWGRPEMGEGGEFTSFPYVRDLSVDPSPVTKDDISTPGNFLPRFFWSLRRAYGGTRTDVLIWKTVKNLTPKSGLMDVPAAMIKALGDRSFAPDEVDDITKRLKYLFRPLNGRRGD